MCVCFCLVSWKTQIKIGFMEQFLLIIPNSSKLINFLGQQKSLEEEKFESRQKEQIFRDWKYIKEKTENNK